MPHKKRSPVMEREVGFGFKPNINLYNTFSACNIMSSEQRVIAFFRTKIRQRGARQCVALLIVVLFYGLRIQI